MRHRYYGKIAGPGEPLGVVPAGPWVALEKIHGAQMLIAVAGDAVRFGKRKAWLADDEPFFGWQLVRASLAEEARAAAKAIGRPRVVLYGELFGGGYPHPEVAAVPGLQPVQTGIWYAPDLRWAAFDALVAEDDEDAGELLSFRELSDMCKETGMLHAPVVRTGPRTHCEGAPTRFASRVPGTLGLPALADNFAEGLVIRPDARGRPGQRATYKRKIAEFDELRFKEAEAWDSTQRPDRQALCAWAARMTNAARIASAVSKWGREDRGAILEEVELDVLIDLGAAFPAVARELAGEDEAAVRAAIRRAAQGLL